MRKIILYPFLIASCILYRCAKDKTASGVDALMFDMAVNDNDFTWYKFNSALLDRSSGSGHPQPYLRTRFNAIAATQLDSSGKVMESIIFPEGSLIVKELWESETSIARYAMLFKDSDNEAADANGWVWGYINENGSVAVPASDQGNQCINCHSQSGNIDYVLMNKYFP